MDYLIYRMGCSFLCGVLISQAGSLIQLATRNILSSSSTLGLDGLAILWTVVFHSLSLLLGQNLGQGWSLFLGLGLFYWLGLFFPRFLSSRGQFERILLIGLTFNLFVGAIFSLGQFVFMAFNLPFPVELWFGHFRFSSGPGFLILLTAELLILWGLKSLLPSLKLFSIGPFMARNWGLNQGVIYRFIFVSAALSTLVVIHLFGAFAFLGLLFPIMSRKLWFERWDLFAELIWGALASGLILMGLDLLCYFAPIYGAEVPVGLLVTAAGAMSLVVLLWRRPTRGGDKL